MIVKLSVFIVAVSFTVLLVKGCDTNADCGRSQCCRQKIGGISLFKGCIDLSQPDERCGGQTRCQCIPGYKCQPDEPAFFNRVKFGNGTCQLDVDLQQQTRRRVFIDV